MPFLGRELLTEEAGGGRPVNEYACEGASEEGGFSWVIFAGVVIAVLGECIGALCVDAVATAVCLSVTAASAMPRDRSTAERRTSTWMASSTVIRHCAPRDAHEGSGPGQPVTAGPTPIEQSAIRGDTR